ncbi:MAG: acyl-ACP--UDP-N-acetylglucosamine O-acyltransferase [Gammaproteobacteria bacterium]|nr:acyl-ACP--UDP-N-acetylglucosamine O-acyltransferase [Gammaproteobacteria bacterium]
MSQRRHPTAIIDPGAQLHETVAVGAYAVIGAGVEIGEGTRVGSHALLQGPMRVGRHNRIFGFVSLGEVSQDKTARAEDPTAVEIGDGNTIREFVTIQRGTLKDAGVTRIGDDNWIMNYVHVAHDCQIGNHAILANNSTLAGHVVLEDYAVLGGATLVAQYCRLGAHCFTAGGAGVTRDVPPYIVVQGNPAVPRGINIQGLRRRGFSTEDLSQIKQIYRLLFVADRSAEQARAQLAQMAATSAPAKRVHEFVARARHLIQKTGADPV